ncbi:MAG: hypothetical protein WCS42_08440 [Verrucomicrobiota bacterium]
MTKASSYAAGMPAYNAVAAQYGTAAADAQWQAAIDAERNSTPLDTSTWAIFGNQLATDPLAAPLASAENIANNTLLSFLKNPTVLVILFLAVGIPLFVWLGGMELIKGSLAKKK